MSPSAVVASPMRSSRRSGRPSGSDTSGPEDHLRALNYRLNFKMTEAETARMMGVHRTTIWRWCEKALDYPEAKQILSGKSPGI